MAETKSKKENLATVKAKRRTYTQPLTVLILFAAVGVLGYKLWENPQIINQAKEMFAKAFDTQDEYQSQINDLKRQMDALNEELGSVRGMALNPNLTEVNQKIENVEQIMVNTIKSKADVEAVLGLVVRMDNVEGRVSDLAKVTDKTALVLTATMLVKDAAEKGGEFVYEAEVLNELAQGNYKIADEINQINAAAKSGVLSKSELQSDFAEIFADKYAEKEIAEPMPEGWKERIYQQVNKVVKVKKLTEEAEEPVFTEEDRSWGIINDMVARGEITKAVAILRKPINAEMLKNEDLSEWLKNADAYCAFYDAVNRITANSLAVMKVKFLNAEK